MIASESAVASHLGRRAVICRRLSAQGLVEVVGEGQVEVPAPEANCANATVARVRDLRPTTSPPVSVHLTSIGSDRPERRASGCDGWDKRTQRHEQRGRPAYVVSTLG